MNTNNKAVGGKGELPNDIGEFFNVNTSSPKDGKIKISLNPKKDLKVGDSAKVNVSLTAPGGDIEQVFWVKISEPEEPKEEIKKDDKQDETMLGLPEFLLAYQEKKENAVCWEDVESATLVGFIEFFPGITEIIFNINFRIMGVHIQG